DKLLISYAAYFLKEDKIISSAFDKPYMFEDGLFYRPVVELLIAAEIIIKNSPVVFHISNIALHIIAGSLFFILLLNLSVSRELSLFLALIFVSHPISSGVVGWIPGMNDSLLAIFIFTGFISFIRYIKSKNIYYLI